MTSMTTESFHIEKPSSEKKSTTVTLTIDPSYRRSWGLWECIREFIQNGLDGETDGYPLTIERGGGSSKTIYIRNEGTVLARDTLLLGVSHKMDGGYRGQRGEGYKIGLLAAVRLGVKVQIRTGSEMWTPCFEKDDVFGREILKVKIRPQPKFLNAVEVQIHGVSDEDWSQFQKNFCNVPQIPGSMQQPSAVVKDEQHGSCVLLAESERSRIYGDSIFVMTGKDSFAFGYDLKGLKLDIDRKLAEPEDLRRLVCKALTGVVVNGSLAASRIYDVLAEGTAGECNLVAQHYNYGWGYRDALTEALADEYTSRHGDKVPVSTLEQYELAIQHQLNAVMLPMSLYAPIQKVLPGLAYRMQQANLTPKTIWSDEDLDDCERSVLQKVQDLLGAVVLDSEREGLASMQIVDFRNEDTTGMHANGQVYVARKQLKTLSDALRTTAHEVAHIHGIDLSRAHAYGFGDLLARACALLMTTLS